MPHRVGPSDVEEERIRPLALRHRVRADEVRSAHGALFDVRERAEGNPQLPREACKLVAAGVRVAPRPVDCAFLGSKRRRVRQM